MVSGGKHCIVGGRRTFGTIFLRFFKCAAACWRPLRCPAMKGGRKTGVRGVSWREKETVDLIAIWGEGRVQNALASSHKNIDVFEDIARQMHALGHSRSPEECRTKSKSLRQEYRRVVNHNAKSGSDPISCAYFELLDCILANDHSVLPPNLKKSSKVRFYNPRASNKENIPVTETDDRFDEELVTINHDDLRTSTPLPTFAIPTSSRNSRAETSDSQDTRSEDYSERVSAGRGSSGLSVASDGDIDDHIDGGEQEEMSSQNTAITDGGTEHDRASATEQARKEEKRANEAQRVRRVALLNDVAMKMLEEGTAEHKETMQFLSDREERKFIAMRHESQLDRRLLQETMQRNADVLTMAVDSIRHLTEVISGTQSIAGAKANPCTCSPSTGPRTTASKGWCAAKRMTDNTGSKPVPEVLVQDTPEESQSILSNELQSAKNSGPAGRGIKRACVGRERVLFEP